MLSYLQSQLSIDFMDCIIIVRSIYCSSHFKSTFILSFLPPFACSLPSPGCCWGSIKSFHTTVSWPCYSESFSLTFVTVDDDVPICQAYGIGGAQQIFVPVWSQRVFWDYLVNSSFPLLCPQYALSLL